MDEFDIIGRYFRGIGHQSSNTVVGSGDDCAVLAVPAGYEMCTSIDTLREGVHFPEKASGQLVAARSFGASMSDLAAMGAEPLGVTVALTMDDPSDEFLAPLAKTWDVLSRQFRVPIVGGNLTRGPLSVTVSVMGIMPSGASLLRSGARPGDRVFVTGHPGNAGGGLKLLGTPGSPDELVDAYTFPVPRIAAGIALRDVATAVIDVSDGLLSDAGHVANESNVAFSIDVSRLPISTALSARFDDAVRLALTAGDDYELLFTTAHSDDAIQQIAQRCSLAMTCIGEVSEGSGVTLIGDVPDGVDVTGYRHF